MMNNFCDWLLIILVHTHVTFAHKYLPVYKPCQVHIALGDSASEIVVTWSTKDWKATFIPVIEYRLSNVANITALATANTTSFVDFFSLTKRTYYVHRVKLTNLRPGEQYDYRCITSNGFNLCSSWFTFKTFPSGTNWSPRVAVYGDLGQKNSYSVNHLKRAAKQNKYDVYIHVGDIAYSLHTFDGVIGDKFLCKIEKIAAQNPYMVCPGNHESIHNYLHYKNRFTMPGNHENIMYSFSLGPAYFISFNTEYYFRKDNNVTLNLLKYQYNWLESELKTANLPENRAVRPWIITYGHRPMYCTSKQLPYRSECANMKPRVRCGFNSSGTDYYGLEKLFYNYGVDLELWAHEHNYERFWPMYKKTVLNGSYKHPYRNPFAPVHIGLASAGNFEKLVKFWHRHMKGSAVRLTRLGYSSLEIHNKTHLSFQFHAVTPHNKTEEVLDKIMLIKEPLSNIVEKCLKMADEFNSAYPLILNNSRVLTE